MNFLRTLIVVSCIVQLGAAEPPAESPEAVAACLQRRVPGADHVRAVRFVTRDRVGGEQVTVVRIYTRTTPEGLRQMLLRFAEPEYMRGAALLMLEREGGSEIHVKAGESEKPKKMTAESMATPLFNTDFSYEDFERLQGFDAAGDVKRLEDDTIGDRPVYVIESRPPEQARSAYESIVTYVDKESCMALRMELYESGQRLRKLFTVNPRQITRRESVWIPQMSMIRDLRDYTSTQLFVDTTEQQVLSAEMFTPAGLARPSR